MIRRILAAFRYSLPVLQVRNIREVNCRFYSEPRQGLISFVSRRNITRAECDRRRDGDRPWRHLIVIGSRLPGTPRRSHKGESGEFLEPLRKRFFFRCVYVSQHACASTIRTVSYATVP